MGCIRISEDDSANTAEAVDANKCFRHDCVDCLLMEECMSWGRCRRCRRQLVFMQLSVRNLLDGKILGGARRHFEETPRQFRADWSSYSPPKCLFSASVAAEKLLGRYKSLIFDRMIHRYEDFSKLLYTTFPTPLEYTIRCDTIIALTGAR